MIKKTSDLSDIRGSLPLMSVIQTDFYFACSETDGVFCQEIDNQKTLVLSLRGPTATICRISDNVDVDELASFLQFRQIDNVLSDFFFAGFNLESRYVLKANPQIFSCGNITLLTPESRLCDYENVFGLLSCNGEFEVWYPPFSKKVNKFCAFGVYSVENSIPISCAVAPFVSDKIGIVAGVFTKESHRKKGYATNCVKGLLSNMKSNGIEEAYLWCEAQNIKLYENIGFSVCGKIYVKKEE